MKQYVLDYANDLLAEDESDATLTEEDKERRKTVIEETLFDYSEGLVNETEALFVMSRYFLV